MIGFCIMAVVVNTLAFLAYRRPHLRGLGIGLWIGFGVAVLIEGGVLDWGGEGMDGTKGETGDATASIGDPVAQPLDYARPGAAGIWETGGKSDVAVGVTCSILLMIIGTLIGIVTSLEQGGRGRAFSSALGRRCIAMGWRLLRIGILRIAGWGWDCGSGLGWRRWESGHA